MLFQKPPTLAIITDPEGSSSVTYRGMTIGRFWRDRFFYFGEPMSRYHLGVKRGRRWLHGFEVFLGLASLLLFFGLFAWQVYARDLFDLLFTKAFWVGGGTYLPVLFWLAVIAGSFLLYRLLRIEHRIVEVEQLGFGEAAVEEEGALLERTWQEATALPRKKRIDISRTFTVDAQKVLEDAFQLADERESQEVTALHVFHALLSSEKIAGVFIRLGVPPKAFQEHLSGSMQHSGVSVEPHLSAEVWQIVFHAHEEAMTSRQPYVQVTELLLATVRQSELLQDMLYTIEVDAQKLTNVVEWVRIRERLQRQYRQFRRAAATRNKYGLDRAMTAVATPFLNNFSQDMTMAAVYGRLVPCVARDKEIEEIFRIVEGGRQSIVLVGDRGVGKKTILEGIAQLMVEDQVPERLKDKRLVQLSTSSLLAGTTVSGAQERLLRMMTEISKAGNIILCIYNLQDLVGGEGEGAGLDVSETLAEFIGSGRVLVFATTTTQGYNRFLLNSQIGSVMSRVDVKEMDENQAIQVLEAKAGHLEYKHNIFFSYNAIAACAGLAVRFLHDQNLPESAIELATEAASYTRSTQGENHLVSRDDVAHIVGEKSGVPVTSITEDEGQKLLRLEEEMHRRVIGQGEAVSLVANALRRARAEIRSTNRPIANFLFLGSTGVGKTELAKTIAEVYFGGEQRMIRIDMSEYQDASGIYRLIGQPGQQGTGLLTETVRQQPFSLVLLDEIEKADPKILDLFLQVFDDGRLTDSVGRVIDFTNTILIATSNAGTSFVQEGIREGKPLAEIREQLIRTELKQFFRPEFLNRFDGLVVFKPLNRDEVKQIAGLMLKRVAKDLDARGIEFRADEAGLEALAQVGFDPEFGARPMRRAIQEQVENQLAEMLLKGELQRRDVVVFDGSMRKVTA